jgi:DNA replication protein DnaC
MENPFESRRFGEPTQVLYSQHNHLTTRHLRHRVQTAVEMLIIDELGFVPLSKTGAELLFEVFSRRYERSATLVTSNLPFNEWTEAFGSERLTGALLDRLTHHVHILEMNGESYRLKDSKRRRPEKPRS